MSIENCEGMDPANFTFNDLVTDAKNEDWERVDSKISDFCDRDDTIDWARVTGVKSDDGNVRDLAVSLFERTKLDLTKQDRSGLLKMVDADDNPYVMFRTAFALFAHGDRSERVIQKIKEALEDDDVKEIAEKYLSQI